MNKKIAIIGASYLQMPLIETAKKMGIETHVFAWAANDVGEKAADYFYPISIVEKDLIAEKCREIQVDGVVTIASDLGAVTANYVADKLGLVGNSILASEQSSNKKLMRECFSQHRDPSPKSMLTKQLSGLSDHEIDQILQDENFLYPVIVKPTDRSGSRGITKLSSENGLVNAIIEAEKVSFEKKALIEEFAEGQEYSVEFISWKGQHHFLQLTHKFTTGAPHFIETGHMEPAPVADIVIKKIKDVVVHALNSLGIEYGASHSEVKIDSAGNIRLIEIGGRMGGDFIGSTLVQLSTGIDFVKAVIQIALGEEPNLTPQSCGVPAGVRFIFTKQDIDILEQLKEDSSINLVYEEVHSITEDEISDSSKRFGCYIFTGKEIENVMKYMPYKVVRV